MKTLDRYVLQAWTRVFLITLLGFPVLVIVIDLTDNLDKYMARGLGRGVVALSYVFGMPETMFLVLPAAVLFATVFTVSAMGRNAELTAAKAGGISFHRTVLPLFAAAVASFFLGLALAEITPVAAARKAELLGERAARAARSPFNFVYRADRGWVYAIRSLRMAEREIQDVILEREGTGPEYPTIIIAARRGRYLDSLGAWMLDRGAVRYLETRNQEVVFSFDSLYSRTMRERPADLLVEPKAPDEMRYAELGRYIDALRRSGSDANKLAVERALKISVPFASIIIAVFGAPLAVTGPRTGVAYGLAVALATTFVCLIMFQLSRAVGASGALPPTLAAWLPNLFFGLAGGVLLARTRT